MISIRQPTVYCADVGSTRTGAFAWACGRPGEVAVPGGSQIEDLAERITRDLQGGAAVALGFECPLFVPVPSDPLRLGAARDGEGSRSWSAAAGAAALATGLAQVTWVLEAIRRNLSGDVPVYLQWDCFPPDRPGLLLWEAFVSGREKTESHLGDAQRAVSLFLEAWPDLARANRVSEGPVFSLVGAALLRAGWTNDVSLLGVPCLVVGARDEQNLEAQAERQRGRPGGQRNSMRTRVVPVFCALMRRDPTGVSWLPKLLALPTGAARRGGAPVTGPFLEVRFGATERPLAPSRALLRWLLEHPDRLKRPTQPDRQPAKRRQLLAGAERERHNALRLLDQPRVPERDWYVLEGASYPDVFLRTPSGIVVIEGKRTEGGVTTGTTWMPVRHQMLRHLDGAWELRDKGGVVGFFIVQGDGGLDATDVPPAWLDRCATTVKPDVLEASLPHRTETERAAISNSYLGVTTWQAVCEALAVPYEGLPDRL